MENLVAPCEALLARGALDWNWGGVELVLGSC
jgi:hypothetical protein